MTHVHLELPAWEGEVVVLDIPCACGEKDARTLRHFQEQFGRVRKTVWLQRGMSGFKRLRWEGKAIVIEAGEASDAELSELLHVLRPVTLEREATSFAKINSLIKKILKNPRLRDFLKLNAICFDDGEMSLYMQMAIDETRLFHSSVLRTWLNGTQYHSDTDKAESWKALESALQASNARALIISQIHSKVKALLNLDYIASRITDANAP
jgi:hypothetical protein